MKAGEYLCDNKRHLICSPYSIARLHLMAADLNIKKCWFDKDHYDIPSSRIKEITAKCKVVGSREIVRIIKENQDYDKIRRAFRR